VREEPAHSNSSASPCTICNRCPAVLTAKKIREPASFRSPKLPRRCQRGTSEARKTWSISKTKSFGEARPVARSSAPNSDREKILGPSVLTGETRISRRVSSISDNFIEEEKSGRNYPQQKPVCSQNRVNNLRWKFDFIHKLFVCPGALKARR